MIKYFKDLLSTLKRIEANLELISRCVKQNHQGNSDSHSLSIKHWNS